MSSRLLAAAPILLLFLPSLAEPVAVESRYTTSWAVEIEGGYWEAERLAQAHGFINRGQVGSLTTLYHFELVETDRVANDVEPSTTVALQNEITVKRAERQLVKRHVKRDYVVPADPGWYQQWALENTGKVKGTQSPMLDLRVEQAWLQGFTGLGTTAAVIDDGLEWSHDDIIDNYDSSISYDFTTNSSDPSPVTEADTHGTECAGVIAMTKNNLCGVGVAFEGKIGGLRIDIDESLDVIEAQALGFQQDRIDIYSNSWGPKDNGFTVEGPGNLVLQTLENGARTGRNGKGNIYVWASGNGGNSFDSCAADGYVNSIYTIAVGSADQEGRQAYYDEDCSAKMAVTFSHNSSPGSTQVLTTTVNGGCSSHFTGTSASAPLMSGIIALTLQANPELTWRDVQYLIAYTSNPDILTVNDLATNGAGLKFSHHFGFGAIDAEAMVTRARHWINVPEQLNFTLSATQTDCVVVNRSSCEMQIKVSDVNISSLEHTVVTLSLTIILSPHDRVFNLTDFYEAEEDEDTSISDWLRATHPRRGDVEIRLRSPSGTSSTLLPFRDYDFINSEGYHNWGFMSVHFWGERPAGVWTLTTSYRSSSGSVLLSNVTLTGFGVSVTPSENDGSEVCELCLRGCVRGVCDSCSQLRLNETLECVSVCPNSTTEYNGYCITGRVIYPSPDDNIARTTLIALVSVATVVMAILVAMVMTVIAVALVVRKRQKHRLRISSAVNNAEVLLHVDNDETAI